MRRRVDAELDKEPPRLGCGCDSSVTSGIECAIASGIKTFTNLTNAGMKFKSTRQTLIARVEDCLVQGGIHFRRLDYYYDKVLRSVSEKLLLIQAVLRWRRGGLFGLHTGTSMLGLIL